MTAKQLNEKLRVALLDDSIKRFSYQVIKGKNKYIFSIFLEQRKLIQKIRFISGYDIDFEELKKYLPYKEGDYYQEKKNSEVYGLIAKYLSDMGLGYSSIKLKVRSSGEYVDLNFKISIGKVIKIGDIKVKSKDERLNLRYQTRFKYFRGRIWDRLKFKVEVDKISNEIFDRGHFFSSVDLVPEMVGRKDTIIANINIKLGKRYNIHFRGINIFTRQELLSKIRLFIKNNLGDFDLNEIKKMIVGSYEALGVYDTKVKVYKIDGVTKYGINFQNNYFDIVEGKKKVLSKIIFIGNEKISNHFLTDLYWENATPLADGGLLDKEYFNKFVDIIKKEYLKNGLIFAEVSGPKIDFVKEAQEAVVEYRIKEGRQTILESIEMGQIDKKVAEKIRKIIKNGVNRPLNVIDLSDDLNKMVSVARSEGYYFAKILNYHSDKILKYNPDFSKARLIVDINLGKKTILDSITINGNYRTKSVVLEREIAIKEGEIITPEKIDKIKNRLSTLGLFSLVRVTPFIIGPEENTKEFLVNLLVQVKEKDFGSVEIAPGYRTDVGIKISSKVKYNNVSGMNRTISIKTQANQRLDFASFDARRRAEKVRRTEYQLATSFSDPYILNVPVEFGSSVSMSRRRFYSFDADIFKVSTQLSKSFSDIFVTSLRYQLESITQFDATDDKDSGYFRIGGLTPAISFDFRDSKVNPRKGAFFGLSYEFANPLFASMKKEDLEVNFYKFISRNKFYLSYKSWTLAILASFGVEKNLADDLKMNSDGTYRTSGYIPGIKVFRLEGIDIVRGFNDGEINTINADNSVDIDEVKVDGKAYFTNIKIEPRYYLKDSTVISAFFDAGKVYVDHYKPLKLRKSVGISLKFLTPVGTLDFDYGIKIRRRRLENNQKERFGKFHLSIGYF